MTNFDVCVVYCRVYSWSLSGYLILSVRALGVQCLCALPTFSHLPTLPLLLAVMPVLPIDSLLLAVLVPVRVALCLELCLPTVHDDSVAFELWMAEFIAVAVRPFSSVSLLFH